MRSEEMKFGIYGSVANPPRGEHLDRCVDEAIEEAEIAEECGFDSYFFGEHHQDKDGFIPAPIVLATAVAARTRRLKVGTAVLLLALHHPVQVAEEAITLDIVSKGRVVLGVGLGYESADFSAFGLPVASRVGRFGEAMEIIRRCFSGERFSFHGKHFTLQDIEIHPRPIQEPGPPIWIGANTPAGARRAGKIADGFVLGPGVDLEAVTKLLEAYRSAAREAGRSPVVALMRDAWVASTRAEAERVYGPEVMTAYKYYWRSGAVAWRHIKSESDLTLEHFTRNRMVLGDPEECIQEFQRWHEATGADSVVLRLRHAHSGGPPHKNIVESIRLFGERVIPYLR